MDDRHGAQVIAFPRPAAAKSASLVVGPEDNAGARLRRALRALEAAVAVAVQRGAVAQWRGALGALGSTVGALHTTMKGYDARLGELRGRVDAVTAEARLLERWAEAAAVSAGMAQEK